MSLKNMLKDPKVAKAFAKAIEDEHKRLDERYDERPGVSTNDDQGIK